MSRATALRLRALWFQIHKWIGLSLALLIVPIALSGAALVWHDALDAAIHPGRYAVSGEAAARTPSDYAAAAAAALGPGARLASLRYGEHGGPIVATALRPGAGGGRPPRFSVWLDPPTARVLDSAPAEAGPVRFLHSLHGSLALPGWGRTIVGLVGVFMFSSCLTGLWLWWPLTGGVRRGWRWKRQNATSANLHHLVGFWVLLPLAMLSFTGAWISFPQLTAGGGGAARPGGPALPLAQPLLPAEFAAALARPSAPGALASVTWPTERRAKWRIGFRRDGSVREVEIDDASQTIEAQRPRPATRPMRSLHDGTGMGPIWQILIFLAGIIPAILAATGIIMWLRSRGWRAALAKRRKAAKLTPRPAG